MDALGTDLTPFSGVRKPPERALQHTGHIKRRRYWGAWTSPTYVLSAASDAAIVAMVARILNDPSADTLGHSLVLMVPCYSFVLIMHEARIPLRGEVQSLVLYVHFFSSTSIILSLCIVALGDGHRLCWLRTFVSSYVLPSHLRGISLRYISLAHSFPFHSAILSFAIVTVRMF